MSASSNRKKKDKRKKEAERKKVAERKNERPPNQDRHREKEGNPQAMGIKHEPMQTLLICVSAFGLGLILYFSGGNHIIEQANSRKSMLRELREKGVTTRGETLSRDRGYKYFDTKRLREIRPSDTYVKYTVEDRTIEVKADTWGEPSGNNLSVRYLPSDPEVSYYTNQPDLLQVIDGEINGYTINLSVVWAVVLAPIAFGVFIPLVSIRPDNGTFNLIALLLVATVFLSLYVYLVW